MHIDIDRVARLFADERDDLPRIIEWWQEDGDLVVRTELGDARLGERCIRAAMFGGDQSAFVHEVLRKLTALIPHEDWTDVAAWQSAGAVSFGEVA